MEKRALIQIPCKYQPLPVGLEKRVYCDKKSVGLPCSEDFPYLHYHDRYEIGICESGEGLFLSEGEYFPLSAGDAVFIAPSNRHYSRSLHESTPCRCKFVYFRAGVLEDCLNSICEKDTANTVAAARRVSAVIRKSEHPEKAEELRRIVELCAKEERGSENSAFFHLAGFILECCDELSDADLFGKSEEKKNSEISCVAEYISLHFSESHSVSYLASLCHLSESQLRRRFKAEYGMAPAAYRSLLRLRVGQELLIRTSLTVSEISDRLGYTSCSDFYRAFVSQFGTSPSEFRKNEKRSSS